MYEGIYEQLINEKVRKHLKDMSSDLYRIDTESLDMEEAKNYLSSYISEVTRKALLLIREESKSDAHTIKDQVGVCNEIIQVLSNKLSNDQLEEWKLGEKGEVLTAIRSKLNDLGEGSANEIERPITSIAQSTLFTGSHHEPNMVEELKKEIASADEIDWLVSFIKWSGLRILLEPLKEFTQRGGKLRVITTSYMEATDIKAIHELSQLKNTEIKVSLDKKRTRLHAKAYLFKRKTGFSTAYIGSSNLSNPALTSGLEWNMKVTEKDSFDIIRKFEATFESYWNDDEFMKLEGEETKSWRRLKASLTKEEIIQEEQQRYFLDVRPYHYQREILEELEVERKIHNRWHNLVVAATGVGKTVISAFDFKRYMQENPDATLLFIAHREEILQQSLETFRMILKDANFGSLFVGRHKPDQMDHLFISIQSWNSRRHVSVLDPTFYDFIIVDEFHHAAAPSYQKLLEFYKPHVLLGLTATPERMDQQDILEENAKDLINGEQQGMPSSTLDRIMLNEERIVAMADAIHLLVSLKDPVGTVIERIDKGNGLHIEKRMVPLGVIGMIYEARPNVTVDAATLALKTGNAVILRGSSSAKHSNLALMNSIHAALEKSDFPKDAVQLIEDTSRETAKELFRLNDYLDVLIPRGGKTLIETVVREATVPVIQTGAGNCHVFIDESADVEMAENIVLNAKIQRPSVCNAIETIIIHKNWFAAHGQALIAKLQEQGVEVFGEETVVQTCLGVKLATDEDWSTEYLGLAVSVKLVSNVDEAIEHINRYGTQHSEAIITMNKQHAEQFLARVDAAAVYHNASTRFTDGFEFGYGAEIGISTQKLHARGPMGLKALTTSKIMIFGEGQIRG